LHRICHGGTLRRQERGPHEAHTRPTRGRSIEPRMTHAARAGASIVRAWPARAHRARGDPRAQQETRAGGGAVVSAMLAALCRPQVVVVWEVTCPTCGVSPRLIAAPPIGLFTKPSARAARVPATTLAPQRGWEEKQGVRACAR
jgi:hypothetical protein